MCGIAGYFNKAESVAAVGGTVLSMLEALACRGPDSSGVALFGPASTGRMTVRVKLGDNGNLADRAQRVAAQAAAFGGSDFSRTDAYLRFAIEDRPDLREFVTAVERLGEDVEVVSVGRRLEIIKQVGSPANLEKTYSVSKIQGTHGIGHTRLSTESRVDLSHSQPFWGHGFADLAIVHNGHITNYHQLRRRYEQRGIRFYTENDSEIIAIYLAIELRKGGGLKPALESMLRDLDGSYSCLAATATEMGFVKDQFALKPLLFTETDRFAAVATEEIAIRSAFPGSYDVREGQVREVRVWQQ
jgi:glutamate synthase domain-containing protein 1